MCMFYKLKGILLNRWQALSCIDVNVKYFEGHCASYYMQS